MPLQYENNAQSVLEAPMSVSDGVMTLPDAHGDRFPYIPVQNEGDWFPLTVIRADGTGYEIMRATQRQFDTIIVTRAQESTPDAITFSAGDIVSLRMTTAAYDEFAKQGDADALILNGLNLGVQTNATSNPYIVELPLITELRDGLRLSFKPTNPNEDGYPSIQLNDLAEKRIKIPYSVTVALEPGDIDTDRVFDFQFSSAEDRWLLETAIPSVRVAGNLTYGGVEIALPNAAVYDTDSNGESFSGARPVYDRMGISAIIQNRERSPRLSPFWQTYGDGTTDFVHTSVSGNFSGGGTFEYKTFKVSNGVEMNTSEVSIVKCAEEIILAGDIIIGPSSLSVWPMQHVGPDGQRETETGEFGNGQAFTGVVPDYVPPQVRNPMQFVRNSILYGGDPFALHGGHGRGALQRGLTDSYVRGRGGLILMAPKITVLSTAKFYLPVRLAESGSTVVTNTTAGGGGVLVFNTEDLDINDAAQFKILLPSDDYERYDEMQGTARGTVNNADPGQVFLANRETGNISRVVQ